MMKWQVFGKNKDHLKHSLKMRTIRNKHYENEDHPQQTLRK